VGIPSRDRWAPRPVRTPRSPGQARVTLATPENILSHIDNSGIERLGPRGRWRVAQRSRDRSPPESLPPSPRSDGGRARGVECGGGGQNGSYFGLSYRPFRVRMVRLSSSRRRVPMLAGRSPILLIPSGRRLIDHRRSPVRRAGIVLRQELSRSPVRCNAAKDRGQSARVRHLEVQQPFHDRGFTRHPTPPIDAPCP